MKHIFELEKPILELEEKIKELKKVNFLGKVNLTKEIEALEKKAEFLKRNIYENLSPWDKVLISRHFKRPTTLDYINAIFDDFFELRGDRLFRDDPAIIGGLAKLENQTVMIIGHQKGRDTKENLTRNFGMPNPEGFRKAYRLMALAEKFSHPIITFIDTPGAYPGIEAEERGQFEAISKNISLMLKITVPIIVTVIGEGGSGGALAIGIGDSITMLENSIFSVISPEGCASILWRDANLAPKAASALRLTAQDLLELKIIDHIINEPLGGAHRDSEVIFYNLKDYFLDTLKKLTKLSKTQLLAKRHEKYRLIGIFTDSKEYNEVH